jgi:hypothetical protein
MRYMVIVSTALLLVLFGTGPGRGSTTNSNDTRGTGTTTTTIHTKHPHAAGRYYKGKVVSADAAAMSFFVHPATGADVTLKVNDKTKYRPQGKGWDDVKAGAAVSGTYKNDGTDNWATTVRFPAPAAAAPAAKTTGR